MRKYLVGHSLESCTNCLGYFGRVRVGSGDATVDKLDKRRSWLGMLKLLKGNEMAGHKLVMMEETACTK